jgi:hypothetical protein
MDSAREVSGGAPSEYRPRLPRPYTPAGTKNKLPPLVASTAPYLGTPPSETNFGQTPASCGVIPSTMGAFGRTLDCAQASSLSVLWMKEEALRVWHVAQPTPVVSRQP